MAEPAWLVGKNAAQALRLEEDLGFAPINVWDVARRRGCEVTRHHFGEGRGDGLYRWDEKRRVALIVVNASERPAKQRFTAAHELGHHEMHRFTNSDVEFADQDVYATGGDPDEQSANAFASYLLAPDEALKRELGEKRQKDLAALDVVELMRKFGLSYESTVYRLHNAGLVNAANRDRLLDEGRGQVELLMAEIGFDEDASFPAGEDYEKAVASRALALYRDAAISAEVLAEALGAATPEEAEHLANERGFARPEDPLFDEAAVAALLEEE
jgi:Zn-dependent peptidase ImmA (M78 family)